MKPFHVAQRYGAKLAFVTTGLLAMGNALAEIPPSVATDVADGKADIATMGGYAIGILLAILLFGWIRRVMR